MLINVIKVREGNADQPLALAVDDDGLIAMLDAQKQVIINPNERSWNQKSVNL